MVQRVSTVAFEGIEARAVDVQVQIAPGLPVIVNRLASIADRVETSGAGVAVEDASGIGAALERVSCDYDALSARACTFFEERLDFRRAFAEVVRRVDALQ